MANTSNLNLYVITPSEDGNVIDFFQKIAGERVDSNFAILDHTIGELQKTPPDHEHEISDITNFPNSMPADGGNADTVGGKHADDFASLDHNHNAMIGATIESDGKTGMVPIPMAGDHESFLRGDGVWAVPKGKEYKQGAGIEIDENCIISNAGVLSVKTGSTNGTIDVDGTDVKIAGLGTSAYVDATEFALAEHSHSDFMEVSQYDPNGEILNAGGIADWIAANYDNAEEMSY